MGKHITAQELGIDLVQGGELALFKWLLASFLMGKRIRAQAAVQTYDVIVDRHGCDTPRKLAACTHRERVRMLGEGGYARYDESTAVRLLALANKLTDEYGGAVSAMAAASADRHDFEKRLLAFDGIGPKTAEIFMGEALEMLF
ncbi:DNA methylase [Pseudomonas sp. W5-36]|uniref:DNA methylase n=1 Tax=Pseudomonas sp. W5-36 TaxID=3097455 RepID=UPI003979743C